MEIKKTTAGYVLTATGLINLILLHAVSSNLIAFITFIASVGYGVYLLSQEDTPVKALIDRIIAKGAAGDADTGSDKPIGALKSYIPYVSLFAAGLAVVAVFLPWVEVSSSVSVAGFEYGGYSTEGFNQSWSSGGISGLKMADGVLGLILALAGAFMAYKKLKLSFLAGALNLMIGLSHLFGWAGVSGMSSLTSNFAGASAESNVDPKVGLYLFIVASLVFLLSSLPYVRVGKSNSESSPIPDGRQFK